MTPSQFIIDAHRTLSPSLHLDKVPAPHLATVVGGCLQATEELDKIKKSLFYGKPYNPDHELVEAVEIAVSEGLLEQGHLDHEQFPNPQTINYFHAVLGMFTEAGELLDHLTNPEEKHETNPAEEMGDLLWYMAIAIHARGLTFEKVFDAVIAKLRKRYPEKFTEEAALVRNIAEEELALSTSLSQ